MSRNASENERLWANCEAIIKHWIPLNELETMMQCVKRSDFRPFYSATCNAYKQLMDMHFMPHAVASVRLPRRRAAIALWLAFGGAADNPALAESKRSSLHVTDDFTLGRLAYSAESSGMSDSVSRAVAKAISTVNNSGRLVSSHPNLQQVRKLADHYQNPGQQTDQTSKESTMQHTSSDKPVEKVTLVYGRNVKNYSSDELLTKVEVIETDIKRFKAIAADSKFLQKRIADMQEAVVTIVAELDSRTED